MGRGEAVNAAMAQTKNQQKSRLDSSQENSNGQKVEKWWRALHIILELPLWVNYDLSTVVHDTSKGGQL
jgi:hypothetical protein